MRREPLPSNYDHDKFEKPPRSSWPGILPLPESGHEDRIPTSPAHPRPKNICGAPCCRGTKLARICDEEAYQASKWKVWSYFRMWLTLDID